MSVRRVIPDPDDANRRRTRQSLYWTTFFVIALIISIASVARWDQLYASNSVLFTLLVAISLLVSVASNLVANKITIAHIKKVGFQGEFNPFARFYYRRFGLRSGYVQAVTALPFVYALSLFFFIDFRFAALSSFFALFPLLLSYDAFQDYIVAGRRE